MLAVNGLQTGYGDLTVLWDVSLEVQEGEIVALLGPNGAGKTTTLKAVMGLIPLFEGEVVFDGNSIVDSNTHEVSRSGLSYVPEDRRLFPGMSVRDNLMLGGYSLDKEEKKKNLEDIFQLFPRLEEREKQYAGTLSGGESQMLAIGRGLMSGPKMVIVDEPSLGLAPQLVEDVFEVFKDLRNRGVTILIVEQNVNLTLEFAQRAYVLEQGEIKMAGESSDLLKDEYIQNAYLGVD